MAKYHPSFSFPRRWQRSRRCFEGYSQHRCDRRHRRGKEKLGWYFATLASWATLFHGSLKNNRMERFVPPLRSVRRTRSHRMKSCVQKGFGGAALNKQTVGNVSVYYTRIACRIYVWLSTRIACLSYLTRNQQIPKMGLEIALLKI